MKVIILAGGFGTRLSEETDIRPKPMVEIGGKPILWHIMKIYSTFGYNDFVICLGYKGYIIKEYFMNYFIHMSDITIDLNDGGVKIHNSKAEQWKITLVDTGLNTMTGARIKRVKDIIGKKRFMLTYGDGVGNININQLIKFHENHGRLATVTAVQPSGRFGTLTLTSQDKIESFIEKPPGDGAWINGGFFVLESEVFDYLNGDETIWEKEPIERLAREGNLFAYKHHGFWKPMDTLQDKRILDNLWNIEATWKIWKD